MLIQLCFTILMLFGIAALTVDLGIVRLTRVQMQNAADTAALEGLRQRDGLGDSSRRLATCQMAAWNFEEGFNPHCQPGDTDFAALGSTPQGAAWLGAGPVIALDGGVAPLNAGQTLNPDTSGVYKPVLQSNQANEVNGDMVSGAFAPGATPSEDETYNRADFAAANGAGVATAPSFLVRLRRTDGCNTLDRDLNADSRLGVASSGPSMPFLFGRALPMHGDPSSTYDPRVHGMTVRATAIADARRALRVGAPGAGLPGATPFAFSHACWNSLADGLGVLLTADAFGNVTAPGCGAAAGKYYVPPAQTVGAPVALTPPGSVLSGPAYMPIYDSVSGTDLIIGFGFVQLSSSGGGVTITRTSSALAAANATSVVAGGFGVISSADLTAVLAANASLGGALLVPALVR